MDTVTWVTVWTALGTLAAGLVVLWLVLVLALWRVARRDARTVELGEMVRLVPDLVRLVSRLARDSSLPRGVRIRLAALLVYLASPLDLVPDFVPILGYADDVVVLALVLRSVVRRAGPEAIERLWPGTEAGLAAVMTLAGASRPRES
ncbi:YkvA family protein [Nocardioides terrisoli]|uniref:YkvA family protein n=1 Tax=Nocardioides terrisoli TaxID=3388267 RepID=UPI00287B7ACA|nr:YkvA family protein [Nocardioides marmorisolisilvae]